MAAPSALSGGNGAGDVHHRQHTAAVTLREGGQSVYHHHSSNTLAPRRAFPGWGSVTSVRVMRSGESSLIPADDAGFAAARSASGAARALPHARLGAFSATSIAGNDLLSSCLYTAGLCAQYSGPLAPVALSMVSFMLYFFRFVYSEVVTAMPVNGGSYNALLNTTSKRVAATAACLSLISYVATAVVSGYDAVIYAQSAFSSTADAHSAFVIQGTVVVLAFFAALTLVGVGESAVVATGMFFFHVAVLTALLLASIVYAGRDGGATFAANWSTPFPDVLTPSGGLIASGSAGTALFFGYAAALLGITGFETAANYVEEMKDSRTYAATLRNMWWAALFNPVISLAAMAVLPMGDATQSCTSAASQLTIMCRPNDLLAAMAQQVGGNAMKIVVCVDGALVLAGSVLTAYVGVTGLVRRMAQDRCLPEVLLHVNKLRSTPHYIIVGFFLLTSSLFLLLTLPAASNSDGDSNAGIDNLSGVYDIAFLSVMSAFAISCMILKWKRPDLPRLVVASWPTVLIALIFVLTGLVLNIIKGPGVVIYFLVYFSIAFAGVFVMFYRVAMLKLALSLCSACLATRRMAASSAAKQNAIIAAHMRAEEEILQRDGKAAPAVGIPALVSHEALWSDESRITAPPSRPTVNSSIVTAVTSLLWKGETAPAPASINDDVSAQTHPLLEDTHDVFEDPATDPDAARGWRASCLSCLRRHITAANARPIVYFAKDGDLVTLNKAILYIRNNEQTERITVVHVVDDRPLVAAITASLRAAYVPSRDAIDGAASLPAPDDTFDAAWRALVDGTSEMPESAAAIIDAVLLLDAVYTKMRIDCVIVRGSYFSPAVVSFVADYLNVPSNMMCMAMPDTRFPHQFAALGGVRVITRAGDAAQRAYEASHAKQTFARIASSYTHNERVRVVTAQQ